MDRESDLVRIPMFDGTNFPSWKFRMLTVLEEHDLKECVEQEVEELVTLLIKDEDSEAVQKQKKHEVEKRKKKDRRCKSLIVSRISDSQLEYVQDQPTPKAMWTALHKVFERKSVASRVHLKKKLLTLRHDSATSLQEHFLVFDKIVREYKSTGAVLDEIDTVCHLMVTLGPKFATVVTALETMPEESLTLEFVKCRLLDEEIKFRAKDISLSVPKREPREPAAFVGKPTKKKLKCFSCHRLGHKVSECPDREKKKKTSANVTEKNIGGTCFVAGKVNYKRKVVWLADSGASEHITNDKSLFDVLEPLKEPIEIAVALNGKSAIAKFRGSVKMIAAVGDTKRECTLKNVLYAPDLRCNLFSIRKVDMAGMEVIFKDDRVKIFKGDEMVACGGRCGLQYVMDFFVEEKVSSMYSCGKIKKCNELWHRRFGHLSEKNLIDMMKKKTVKGLEISSCGNASEIYCESCIEAKQTRKPFIESTVRRSSRVLELIHTDVCGPFSPVAHDGTRYYVSFIDDWSRFTVIYRMQSKDEVLKCFKLYEAMVSAKFERKISRIRCDNGGEYRNELFYRFCRERGIQMECTVPYTPEQNGVSERMNRTLVEKARAMLFGSKVDKRFWCEAVETAAYLANRSPASALQDGKTPAELWEGRVPDVSGLRVWGSPAYCHVPQERRKKLDSKAWKGIFLGYHCNGYRIWDPKWSKVVVLRDVVIDEINHSESDKREQSIDMIRIRCEESDSSSIGQGIDEFENVIENLEDHVNNLDETMDFYEDCEETLVEFDSAGATEECPVTRNQKVDGGSRNVRKREPPVWHKYYDMNCVYALSAMNYVEKFPDRLEDMKKRDDWPQWQSAIDEEKKSHEKNGTWTLCKLPKGRKPVSCKWVFRIKRNEDGSVDRYKARLVARGFSQRFGYDYTDTYAPVARLDTVRTVLAVANQERLEVHQMDVKTAFLNGILREEIYMTLPEGVDGGPDVVCKLNRALYGLKQASKAWNERFHELVTNLRFQRSENDRCLYVRGKDESKLFLLLYVDDILIISRNLVDIEKVKKRLAAEFEMSDLGSVKNFLGMRIDRNVKDRVLRISQRSYLESLLRRFGMEECKPVATPIECRLKLTKGLETERTNQPYRELIGCLTYVAQSSRPDLCVAVNLLSQHQSCPTNQHWVYLKRILRYIKGTLDIGLEYRGGDREEPLVAYSDADWGNDVNDRRSISGGILKVFGSTVMWMTRKQQTVALSSTEAEFMALCITACDGIWLRRMLNDLGIVVEGAVTYYEDNQSCIRVAEEPKDSRRLKHVDIKYNFIRELVQEGKIQISYIPTEQQLADLMTKGLPASAFNRLREDLGLRRD